MNRLAGSCRSRIRQRRWPKKSALRWRRDSRVRTLGGEWRSGLGSGEARAQATFRGGASQTAPIPAEWHHSGGAAKSACTRGDEVGGLLLSDNAFTRLSESTAFIRRYG